MIFLVSMIITVLTCLCIDFYIQSNQTFKRLLAREEELKEMKNRIQEVNRDFFELADRFIEVCDEPFEDEIYSIKRKEK